MDAAVWQRLLREFHEESGGDEPSEESLDAWEVCLLARLAGKELGLKKHGASKLEALLLTKCENSSLQSVRDEISRRFQAQASKLAGDNESPAPPVALARAAGAAGSVLDQAERLIVGLRSPGVGKPRERGRSRSRSPLAGAGKRVRTLLQEARNSLRDGLPLTSRAVGCLAAASDGDFVVAADRLLRLACDAEAAAERIAPPTQGLAAPPCFGPPAFFPVGNAAGRHEAITRGLSVNQPRLLFIGISDPRHLFTALDELPQDAEVSCVLNDLNAETSARNALLVGLLRSPAAEPRAVRIFAAFALWWSHELPAMLLPMLVNVAEAVASDGSCCPATAKTLRQWAACWSADAGEAQAAAKPPSPSQDLAEVLAGTPALELSAVSAAVLAGGRKSLVSGCVDNCTLQHLPASLDYGLYRERAAPAGFQAAGDGLLLWPDVPADEEFTTDSGQPLRAEYVAVMSRHVARFADALDSVSEHWLEPGRVRCDFVAGDCLTLPGRIVGGFHRVFTSNVADHVGIPGLALSLGPFLRPRSAEPTGVAAGAHEDGIGEIRASLSNNLRALDSSGAAHGSLCLKLHGATLDTVAAACGLGVRVEGLSDADQVVLRNWPLPDGSRMAEALRTWPAECARRLYRCPPPDAQTVARRVAQGECRGMAHRYARRFTVSPVTVACIARLLDRAIAILPAEEALRVCDDVLTLAKHSRLRFGQCLTWGAMPKPIRSALEGLCWSGPCDAYQFEIPRKDAPYWAWRTHPPVVVLWIRAKGLASARQAGIRLEPSEPAWPRCRTRGSVAFLDAGVWGPLRWALEAHPDEVQLLDGLAVQIGADCLRIVFPLTVAEAEYGVGSAAFLLSLVDNTIISGPHQVEAVGSGARTAAAG